MEQNVTKEMKVKIHVFEPEDSPVKQPAWYKDPNTFKYSECFLMPESLYIGDVIEDDMGARFKIISRHWKWDKDQMGETYPVLEFTVERYMRRGKQNPFMI